MHSTVKINTWEEWIIGLGGIPHSPQYFLLPQHSLLIKNYLLLKDFEEFTTPYLTVANTTETDVGYLSSSRFRPVGRFNWLRKYRDVFLSSSHSLIP